MSLSLVQYRGPDGRRGVAFDAGVHAPFRRPAGNPIAIEAPLAIAVTVKVR